MEQRTTWRLRNSSKVDSTSFFSLSIMSSSLQRLMQPTKRILLGSASQCRRSQNDLSHRLFCRVQSRSFTEVQFSIKPAPEQFQYVVIATGLLITGGSVYFLAENLLFGTAGGIVAKTCTAPLERLTTHRQASIDSRYSIGNVVSEIYREEGLAGFWRGNGLNVFRASIQKGSLFALNDFFKSMISRSSTFTDSSSDSAMLSFCCGSLAGITSTVITYPLDPVKVRLHSIYLLSVWSHSFYLNICNHHKTVNQATIHQRRWPAMAIWYSLSQSRGYLMGPWTAGAYVLWYPLFVYFSYDYLSDDVPKDYRHSLELRCITESSLLPLTKHLNEWIDGMTTNNWGFQAIWERP